VVVVVVVMLAQQQVDREVVVVVVVAAAPALGLVAPWVAGWTRALLVLVLLVVGVVEVGPLVSPWRWRRREETLRR
jgi:hypothetical protein